MSDAGRYLIDTMVASEPMKERPDGRVMNWFEKIDKSPVFLSVVTVGEIERGIQKIALVHPAKAERFRAPLEDLVLANSDNMLPVDLAVIRLWGKLTFELKHTNPDVLIGATALAHDLTLVTRNTRHFAPMGVRLFNPYGD